MQTLAPQSEFSSIGFVCQLMQVDPRRLRTIAESVGVVPAMRLNGVDHFDADGVARLVDARNASGYYPPPTPGKDAAENEK